MKKRKILVACETSQAFTAELIDQGYDAVSCDLSPGKLGLPHIQKSVFDVDVRSFTSIISFPPCTYLAKVQMYRYHLSPVRCEKRDKAVQFVRSLLALPVKSISVENPVGYLNKNFRPPESLVYPWQFGDMYRKEICLWLKGFPPVLPLVSAVCPQLKIRHVKNHTNGRMSQEQKSEIKSSWVYYPKTIKAMINQWEPFL